MYKLVSFLLMLFSLASNAQTKEETEKWINFYLDKYFARSERTILLNREGTHWQTLTENGNFFFQDGFLYHFHYSSIRWYPENKIDTVDAESLYRMRLKRIKKLTYAISPDSTDFYCHLNISFYEDYKTPVVTVKRRNSDEYKPYQWDKEYDLQSTNRDVLRDSIPQRLIKAFNHLVSLNEGKIIRDVF